MPDNKKQGRSNKTMTFFVCFLAALAGLLFGLDIGVIAGALPFIANEFQISAHTQEWVVSSMMFGAAVGAVGSGWLSFKLGRKKSLMIGAILFVAGSLFSAAAPNVEIDHPRRHDEQIGGLLCCYRFVRCHITSDAYRVIPLLLGNQRSADSPPQVPGAALVSLPRSRGSE